MNGAAKPVRMADLDSDLIVATALAILEERGISGFTMRGVAEALGVTPMALYHHVKDKAALAVLVVEASGRERALPPPTGDWRVDMWGMARWMRQTALARPAVGRLRSAYGIWTPSILQITERWMGLWKQSGLPLEIAIRAATLSSTVIVGFVDQEIALADMQRPNEALLATLPDTRLAFTAAHDWEADFEIVVRAVIDGLHSRLEA